MDRKQELMKELISRYNQLKFITTECARMTVEYYICRLEKELKELL